jgi:hypothetical protein
VRHFTVSTSGAPQLTRRTLVLGAAGLLGTGLAVASCGGSDSSADSGPAEATTDTPASTALGQFVVVQRYPNTSLTPGNVRLPISIASSDGSLLTSGPDQLTGAILDAGGSVIAPLTALRFGQGHAVPYWPITATLDAPGVYYLAIDGTIGEPTPFQLFDIAEVAMPTVGTELPGFDTPTVGAAGGVDPICTRDANPCPFHAVTLTEALTTGKPVVYIVGTPAHCSTGTCAPGLEFLIESAATYGADVTFVHAEVYADPEGTMVAPAVEALALDYEPVIWVADATGTVTSRIDIVWDAAELETLLAAALA